MNDTATMWTEAANLLASFFYEIACEEGIDFESFESKCIFATIEACDLEDWDS